MGTACCKPQLSLTTRMGHMSKSVPAVRVSQKKSSLTVSFEMQKLLRDSKAEYFIASHQNDELQLIPITEEGVIGVVRLSGRFISMRDIIKGLGLKDGAIARAEWREGAFSISLKDLKS